MGNTFGKNKSNIKSPNQDSVYTPSSFTTYLSTVNEEYAAPIWFNIAPVCASTTNLEPRHPCKPDAEVVDRYEGKERQHNTAQINTFIAQCSHTSVIKSPIGCQCTVNYDVGSTKITNSVSSASANFTLAGDTSILQKPATLPPTNPIRIPVVDQQPVHSLRSQERIHSVSSVNSTTAQLRTDKVVPPSTVGAVANYTILQNPVSIRTTSPVNHAPRKISVVLPSAIGTSVSQKPAAQTTNSSATQAIISSVERKSTVGLTSSRPSITNSISLPTVVLPSAIGTSVSKKPAAQIANSSATQTIISSTERKSSTVGLTSSNPSKKNSISLSTVVLPSAIGTSVSQKPAAQIANSSATQPIISSAERKSTVGLTSSHTSITNSITLSTVVLPSAIGTPVSEKPAVKPTTKTESIGNDIPTIRKIRGATLAYLSTVNTQPVASDLLKSTCINDDNDHGHQISQTISKPAIPSTLTFTNSKYQTKIDTNQRNQTSKSSFKLYVPRHEIRFFFNNNFKKLNSANSYGDHIIRLTDQLKLISNQLTEQNYLDALLLFVDIEDLHCENAILVYNRKSEKIECSGTTGNYLINIPNLNDSRPSISVYSRLTIISHQLENVKPIYGTILDIQPKHIVVEFKDTIDTEILYDVNFLSNRTTFRMEKLAIELMGQKNLVHFMFPNPDKVRSSNAHHTDHHFTWFNKSVAKNLEQQTVIENIYHGTSYPYPYILFGPPGTGKTTTLVESILQLWKNKIDTRILIVSTSNFTCNVISKRLLEFLPKTEIFRLFSKSQEVVVDKIDTLVLKASNLETKTYCNPKPSDLYPYRIIIATLTASGRLIQDGFDTDHFTHLFIDECGSCTEGSSLIPIAGLISLQNTIKGNIILAGDPLQLGPVIQSKYAENLGYDVSMIERLMEFPLYKKDERIGDYNNKFITKLRSNYRSHKDILHIPNQLFYNNELKALGSKDVTDWIINWKCLPNPKFPIMFVAVFGESLHENDSPSLYNTHEIKVVMSYLCLLVNKNINGKVVRQTDIGIITPYRKQNQKIRAQCDYRKWRDIEVASVEAFQGNEKRIIIFSTVRSNVDSMGFLNSERRLNVALTRAQGCLIIIGDPKILMKDKCWYQLMKFCYDNNAICGEPFNFYD